MENCDNCKFAVHLLHNAGKKNEWLCRRSTPIVLKSGMCGWPATSAKEWCGEYKEGIPRAVDHSKILKVLKKNKARRTSLN